MESLLLDILFERGFAAFSAVFVFWFVYRKQIKHDEKLDDIRQDIARILEHIRATTSKDND